MQLENQVIKYEIYKEDKKIEIEISEIIKTSKKKKEIK